MRRSVTSNVRIADFSGPGGFVTGLVEPAWEPEKIDENNTVVQIGEAGESFGSSKDLIRSLAKHVGIEEPGIITIGSDDSSEICCDIVECKKAYFGQEAVWYQIDKIAEKIPSTWPLLVINKTENPVGQTGILEHTEMLSKSGKIAVTGVDFPDQHSLALRIAQLCRGFIRLDSFPMGENGQVSVAIIDPSEGSDLPEPLPYPSIAKILPRGMDIDHPKGVGNDYAHLERKVREREEDWFPKLGISVVIPLYNRKEMLGRTLAMISHQTYPLDLIEVVVADDGSSDNPIEMIEKFQEDLEINYVRQADRGYRLSEIRNLGIRSSKFDYVILLDCDMAPVPTMVESYARNLEVSTRALYCGHRRYVDANHIDVKDVMKSPKKMLALTDIETMNDKMKRDGHVLDWRMPMYRQTDNLRFERYPFRAVCGGNIGFHKSLFERAGEFDDGFQAWGKEDTEWGFRVWNRGDYIIPLYEACGLHMEPPGGRNETDRELGLKEVMPIFIDRVPVMYRKDEDGDAHSVPLVSIYIPAFNAEKSIVETVQSALDQTFTDIEVCVAVDGSRDGTLKQLEKHFLDNPRVRWVFQENQGIGGASNTAVQMCRGVFIGQLDSDDLLLPRAVEILLEEIQKDTRVGVVYGSFQKETPDGDFLEDGYDWPEYSREKLMLGCIVHHFRMFRARDWWRTDGFAVDMKNAVDYDMFLKMSEVTEMAHVKEWTYVYRIHDSSTSISHSKKQIENHSIAISRSLSRRGLDNRWEVTKKGKGETRNVRFSEKKNWQIPQDTTTPFAKMESGMKEAAPLIVQKLARMEANSKPWTISDFPIEKNLERIQALAKSKGLGEEGSKIKEIHDKNKNNLHAAFRELENSEKS